MVVRTHTDQGRCRLPPTIAAGTGYLLLYLWGEKETPQRDNDEMWENVD